MGISKWDKMTVAERRRLLSKATYNPKDAYLSWWDLTPGQREDVWEVMHGRRSFSERRGLGDQRALRGQYRGYGDR